MGSQFWDREVTSSPVFDDLEDLLNEPTQNSAYNPMS